MYKGYIGNLLSEEVRSVSWFLCAKYVFSTEINGKSIDVYSDKVFGESSISGNGAVPKWSKENPRWQLPRSARHIKDGWDLSTSGDLITGNRLVT